MIVNNIISGTTYQSYLEGGAITDMANSLVMELRFNPWSDNSYKGMFKRAFKLGFGKKKKTEEERPRRNDDVHIKIF